MGGEDSRLAANPDRALDNRYIRPRLVRRWTVQEANQSTSWGWSGNIRLGLVPIYLWMVDVRTRAKIKEDVRAAESYGKADVRPLDSGTS